MATYSIKKELDCKTIATVNVDFAFDKNQDVITRAKLIYPLIKDAIKDLSIPCIITEKNLISAAKHGFAQLSSSDNYYIVISSECYKIEIKYGKTILKLIRED